MGHAYIASSNNSSGCVWSYFFLDKVFPVYDVVNKMLGENKKWIVLTTINMKHNTRIFADLIRWENMAIYKPRLYYISALIVIL